MIKHLVTEIGGIENVGVISICLFFAAFGGTLIWALCLKKSYVKNMGGLALQDETGGTDKNNSKGEIHHV